MKYTAILATAAAAVASAQVTYNETTGKFTCAAANPNGAFCAGDSLKTNIIIRCTDGVGQPGNCNDNLAGYFPYGVRFAACYQSSPTAGDAACSKNCIVHAPAGDFTLPGCTPSSDSSTTQPTSSGYATPSSSGYATPSSSGNATPSTSNYPTTTPSTPPTPPPTNETTTTITITETGTTTCITDGSTVTSTYTTVYCPKCQETVVPSLTTTTFIHSGTGSPAPPTNATIPTTGPTTGPATATPVGPTTTVPSPPTEFTGAASMNSAGSFLIGLGFAAAYFI